MFKFSLRVALTALPIVACSPINERQATTVIVEQKKNVKIPSKIIHPQEGVTIQTYELEEIKRKSLSTTQ